MPGFSIERNGFPTLDTLLVKFLEDLTTYGNTMSPVFKPFKVIKAPPGVMVVESDEGFLLGTSQPWRMAFKVDDGLTVNVGTPLQIDNTGYVVTSSWNKDLKSGQLSTDTSLTDQRLISYDEWGITAILDTSDPDLTNWPMSYRLTVTDRGFIFFVWGEALTEDWRPSMAWFAIQRPVHPDTGAPLVLGKCPLYCLHSRNGGNVSKTNPDLYPEDGIRQCVIREVDINVPRRSFSAVYHTDNGNAMINPTKQIAFTEDREYLVTFPNGLTTSRYAYIHEYDMLAYTSADVIPPWVVAEISMYGESTPRKYVSMPANGPKESYMRLLVLIEGGGVTETFPDPALYVGTREITP